MNIDKLISVSEELNEKNKRLFFAYLTFIKGSAKKILPVFVGYSILLFIFFSIYDYAGFERTIIIMAVSFLFVRELKEVVSCASSNARAAHGG